MRSYNYIHAAWLLALGFIIYLFGVGTGKPSQLSTPLIIFAWIVYVRARDEEAAQATSCTNCNHTAEFCRGCCDCVAAASAKDAGRYRLLRAAPTGEPWGTPRIAIPASDSAGEFVNEEDADEAVDAAILAAPKEVS